MRGSIAASAHRRGARRGGVGEEAVQDAGQVEAGEHAGDLVAGEHVGGDEAAERGAETLLLGRDDGGVGDRDAERVAEQRGDREPVGDAADEAGLGGGLQQVGGGGGGEGVAAERERGHQDEERRWRRRGDGAGCGGLRRRGPAGSWGAAPPAAISVSPALGRGMRRYARDGRQPAGGRRGGLEPRMHTDAHG